MDASPRLSLLLTGRIDAGSADQGDPVRSETAKHRHAIARILLWLSIALLWFLTVVLALGRHGIPRSSLAVPTAVAGAALGFGAQTVVRDHLAGLFIIAERQSRDLSLVPRASGVPSRTGTSGVLPSMDHLGHAASS